VGAEANALRLGLDWSVASEPKPWKPCRRAQGLIFTAGHTSRIEGKLGVDLAVAQGYAASREAMTRVLQAVHHEIGSLDAVRPVKLLGFINAAPEFMETPAVLHGASDWLHQIFGPEAGAHSRSAIGVVALPHGAAVEIEAVFEIVAYPTEGKT
jgi:enamine deaminase RidA (YjgF/YER057c/UK114 family)